MYKQPLSKKKSAVLKRRRSDMRFCEGYINVYCNHVHCCHCEVTGKINLFTFVGRVEGNVNFSGKRSHFIECVKSRHITGKHHEVVAEKLQFMKPHSLYRSMQSSLTLSLPRSSIDDLVFSVLTSNFVKLSYKISLIKNRFVTLFFIRFS